MLDRPLAANYCPQGCYWPCEHRVAATPEPKLRGKQRPARERWELGPPTGDDPEQLALDEWRLYSVAGIQPSSFFAVEFCSDCGESFSDAAEHAHLHARRRQLDLDR